MLKKLRDLYFWLAAYTLLVNAVLWCTLFLRQPSFWNTVWMVVLGTTFIANAVVALKLRDYRKIALRLEELENDNMYR